jgi:hypothetical protein
MDEITDVREISANEFGNWYSRPFWSSKAGGQRQAIKAYKGIRHYGRDNYMNVYSVRLNDGSYWDLTSTDGMWRERKTPTFGF